MRELTASVILPVIHGGGFLKAALRSAVKLNFPNEEYEILVLVQERDQDARGIIGEMARNHPGIVEVTGSFSTRSTALNRACDRARGRIFAFADDDCVLPPQWLQRIVETFRDHPRAGAIGGPDRRIGFPSILSLSVDFLLTSGFGTGRFRSGSEKKRYSPRLWNMAVTRETVFQCAGGPGTVFDEGLPVHEDGELMERIRRSGKELRFVPDLVVDHHRDTTFGSFLLRNFHMARVCRKEGIHRGPHLLLTIGLFAVFLSVAVLFALPALALPAAVPAIYFAFLAAAGVGAWLKYSRTLLLLSVPLLLLGLHLARSAGYMIPISTRRRP